MALARDIALTIGRAKKSLNSHAQPGVRLLALALLLGLSRAPLLAQAPEGAPPPAAAAPAPRADLGPARELVRGQKYPEAETLLADLQTAYPDDPSLLLLRGEVLLAIRNPQKAAEVLGHAAEVAPRKLRVHFGLGSALSEIGDTSGALAAFATEIELNPDPEIRAKARVNRSVLYEREKKWSESAAELEALLAENPEHQEIYGDLAQLYLKADRPEDALKAVERGADKGPAAARLYVNIGADYYNKKSFEQAANCFGKALEIDPGLAQAELNLARALDHLDRKTEADSHLKRYLELRPDAPEAAEIKKRLAVPPTKKSGTKTK